MASDLNVRGFRQKGLTRRLLQVIDADRLPRLHQLAQVLGTGGFRDKSIADHEPIAIPACYRDLIDGLVLDRIDEAHIPAVDALGIPAITAGTVMRSLDDREQLARTCLKFAASLA